MKARPYGHHQRLDAAAHPPRWRARRRSTPAVVVSVVCLLIAVSCSSDGERPAPGAAGVTASCIAEPTGAAGVSGGTAHTLKVPDAALYPKGPGRLTGHVIDGACGTPVADEVVVLYAADQDLVLGSTRTDDTGRYVYDNLAAASYRLGFVDVQVRYVASFHPLGNHLANAQPIRVGSGETVVDEQIFTPQALPAPAMSESPDSATRRVVVVGDSIVQQSGAVIHEALDPLGPTSVGGIVYQTTEQLMPLATKMATYRPTVVVLAVGNNDVRQHIPIDTSMATLRSMVALFPEATCVVVLTINAHSLEKQANADAVLFNQKLVETVASLPNGRLLDWDALVVAFMMDRPQGQTWSTDGLHLNAQGQAAFAGAMRGAIAGCPA